VYSRIPFKILIKNVSREDWIIPAGSKIAIAKNPTPIPKEGESISESKGANSSISDDNIQVQIQGERDLFPQYLKILSHLLSIL